jgi:DNA-binding MarR family transcriptional regulator
MKSRAYKLHPSDVEAIRAAYARGGVTQVALAERHGITQSCVSRILGGSRWKVPA